MADKIQMARAARWREEIDSGRMLEAILSGDSHMKKEHVGKTNVQMMDRLLRQQKSASTFPDMETAQSYLIDAMYARMEDIAQWADSDEYQFAFSIPFGDLEDPAQPEMGTGFRFDTRHNAISYRYPNTVNVVLQKDKGVKPYGFSLYTAYPEVNSPDTVRKKMPQGQMQALIRETEAYQKAGNIQKGFYDYHAFYKNPTYRWQASYGHDKATGADAVFIEFPYHEKPHRLSVTKDGVSICSLYQGKEREPDKDFACRDAKLIKAICKAFPDNAMAFEEMAKTSVPFLYIDNQGRMKNTLRPIQPRTGQRQRESDIVRQAVAQGEQLAQKQKQYSQQSSYEP